MSGVKVLVVEDNKADIALLSAHLKQDKIINHFHYVQTIDEALIALREDHYAVMMLDMNLGVESGITLLKSAKKEGLLEGVRVIALSGVDDPEVEKQADLYGVFLWLKKPLCFNLIHAMVREVPEFAWVVVATRGCYES